jgi:hypothetical protein
MTDAAPEVDLSDDELRVVARFAVRSAQEALSIFEGTRPDDDRPRAALGAAWLFANGGPRTNLQRVAAIGAHRAARDAGDEAALYAARAAGDAAAAAYLHPIVEATQVGHILRATACAAHAAELMTGADMSTAEAALQRAHRRATPTLLAVLRRYPPAPEGSNRVGQLMKSLDSRLRGIQLSDACNPQEGSSS